MLGPSDHQYLLWKSVVNVAPTATQGRTMTVVSPATARLAYFPAAVWPQWGQASGDTMLNATRKSIHFDNCSARYSDALHKNPYTEYLGGILVAAPTCVTIQIVGPGSRQVVRVPIAVAHC